MLAYTTLDGIADCEPEAARPFQRKVERYLYSALSVIVREGGIDLREFGGEFYAPERVNPFPANTA